MSWRSRRARAARREAERSWEDARRRARAGQVAGLRALLRGADLRLVIDELERMAPAPRAAAFRILPRDTGLRAFIALGPALQAEVLEQLGHDEAIRLVADLDPDDRARTLDGLPDEQAAVLLEGLSEEARRETELILRHPAESVGRWTTPAVVSVPADRTVGDALELVRTTGSAAETVYVVPVLDELSRVVGVVSLRRLITADQATPLSAVMREPILLRADEDQEVGARLVRDHGAVGVPVVDDEDRLVGILTVDDAMHVLELEEDEDTARSASRARLDRPYLGTSVLQLARGRVLWLLALVLAAGLTVTVLDRFEATLEQVVTLALFIPLLIGTGGNVGAQSASTVIRALAVEEIRASDLLAVVGKELATGVTLGATLGLVAYLPATWFADSSVALVLSLSVLVVCALAASVGALIPILAERAGVDPAVMSAPLITTVVDATGLLVYFLIAGLVLGI
ncbi:magnesium transporter [Ornithinimicrobium humiphilum]|uniref:Magnesium transporter MgtE n=1 Tax=Ornithinimicrobium humiphilum TaxID=125288 RepID=A0A543KM11_9MICO|nr:magnesium transporter [Ornithinimicrobium humiphilum]TQM96125.1 magnesium transporter [Ornithinimicrobium humiphilum]